MTHERTTWDFYSAGRTVFGCGAVARLGSLAMRNGTRHALIITDQGLAACGAVDRNQQSLETAGVQVSVFDGGEPEPSLDAAAAAVACAQELQPDTIVGLGGGSNMDLAKITANLFSHGGQPQDYFGFDQIPGPTLPLIAVPTTAGTGSEVSHAAVLTDTVSEMKFSTLSPHLRPTLAVVDPELTLTCPAVATADSGIDALTHAIEAYTAIDYNQLDIPVEQDVPYSGRSPLSDCLAEKAIRLIGQHLVTAVQEPQNLEARTGMALAATLAGLAFSNCGIAVVHALEYPLGGSLHCSHGAGNGLLLPYVMRYNMPVRTEALADIACWMGVNTAGMDPQQAAEQSIVEVERLKQEIGIPQRIRDIGGTAEQLPEFARKSFAIDRLMLLNPRRPTEAELLDILKSAL